MPRVSDSRERLIDTTARLLWTQGFHATGLNQILQESGAPKGSLYFHFPGGKEQLSAEALRLSGRRMTKKLEQIFGGSDTPADALRGSVTALAKELKKSDFTRGCPVATVTLEAATESDALRTVCSDFYDEWRSIIARKLEASGRTATDAESLATLVLASIEGGLMLARAQRNVRPLLVLTEEIAKIL
jgi:TetR/AcrR family transcriptional regulator, lmrAB and yxaGH operons repressor